MKLPNLAAAGDGAKKRAAPEQPVICTEGES
jgi:hypothetical protein